MGISAEQGLLLACLAMSAISLRAQPGTTFAYTGDDAVVSALNTHHAHFGGFSNSVLVYEEENFVWPYLPALFYEYDYLPMPGNHGMNVLLCATPEVNLFPFFVGRVSGLLELGLGADADNKPGHGFGFRFGGGFSALGTTFGLAESSPVLRAGFTIDNVRVTYMRMMDTDVYVNHHLAIGLKFDW